MLSIERLKKNLTEIGSIGQKNGEGVTRLGFSPEYAQAAELVRLRMEQAGLRAWIDGVGNVIGEKKGRLGRGTIWTGSHLDTVKNGGLFDGCLGVAAALEVACRLQETKKELDQDLRVVAFQAEEGGAWGGTFGSRALMGMLSEDDPAVTETLRRYGLTPDAVRNAQMDVPTNSRFLELHIEQGGTLEAAGCPIGVVTGIVGINRYLVTTTGQSNHAGTTSMARRRDAFTATAKLAVEIDALARERKDNLVATIGELALTPNMSNVIPGRVEAALDVRHLEPETIRHFMTQVEAAAARIASTSGVEIAIETFVEKPGTACDGHIIRTMKSICEENGVSHLELPSGAGHDACALAARMPVAMLFVPSKGGMSHCPEEDTAWENTQTGVDVLWETILRLDKEEG